MTNWAAIENIPQNKYCYVLHCMHGIHTHGHMYASCMSKLDAYRINANNTLLPYNIPHRQNREEEREQTSKVFLGFHISLVL